MIDAKDLEAKARGRWYGILTSLGVPESYLTGKHGSCLFCSGLDRWRWDNKDGSGSFFCNQCSPQSGSGITLVQKHLGINYPEALKRINEVLGGGYTKMDTVNTTNNKMSEPDIKAMLNKMWTAAQPLSGNDQAARYLHDRGLVLTPDNVRFSPELYENDTKKNYPAMIAKIVDKNNQPKAIHRTYLDPDVPKKADIASPKKMTPAIGSLVGCAVRLFEPVDNEIIICEGLETALACKQLFDIPAWACLSSTIMQGFEPPEGIRKVIICGDADANHCGQKAAHTLANKLYLQDYIIDVWLPEILGNDFADELWRSIK